MTAHPGHGCDRAAACALPHLPASDRSEICVSISPMCDCQHGGTPRLRNLAPSSMEVKPKAGRDGFPRQTDRCASQLRASRVCSSVQDTDTERDEDVVLAHRRARLALSERCSSHPQRPSPQGSLRERTPRPVPSPPPWIAPHAPASSLLLSPPSSPPSLHWSRPRTSSASPGRETKRLRARRGRGV